MNILNTTGYEQFNPSIIQAKDCVLTDNNGNQYYDFESGVWALPLGHNHPRVNQAIINQLSQITHVGYRYSHPVVEAAAEALLQIMNLPEGKCVFLSSGSEAVEYAIKAVLKITDRPKLLRLGRHYLSAYGVTGDVTSERWITIDWQAYLEKNQVENSKESIDSINYEELLCSVPFEEISAFVFEPGNTSGMAKLPPKELIQAITTRVKANQGFIVVDEVTTGMGRTGKWFGYEYFDIQPDIIACGKGLGNGYPVSAVGFSKELAALTEQAKFLYAQSHQNDPMGCAVTKEVIAIIKDEGLLEHAKLQGEYFRNEVSKLSLKHPCIKEVRGVGLMCAVEMDQSYHDKLSQIHKKLYEAGYFVGLSQVVNVFRFYPPLTIKTNIIDRLIAAFSQILSEV